MFLISFYIIENVENDNGKFKDEMVLSFFGIIKDTNYPSEIKD
jgi:hypothetical protein